MKIKIYIFIMLFSVANIFAQIPPDFMLKSGMTERMHNIKGERVNAQNNLVSTPMLYDLFDNPEKFDLNFKNYALYVNVFKAKKLKSEQENAKKECLDSVYYFYGGAKESKDVFTYDANGNLTMQVSYSWDSGYGQWINSSKDEYTYDTNGNETLEVSYNWDSGSSQWVEYIKYEYGYDNNGNLILMVIYYWDSGGGQWVNSNKYEYSFDVNGNLILQMNYIWDSGTGQWINSTKNEYTYDANGNLTLQVSSRWDSGSGQWNNYFKLENTYDANGNVTLELRYSWDSGSGQWVEYMKVEYTYDANGNQTLMVYSRWDSGSAQWIYSFKNDYTYDENGNRTIEVSYNWISGSGQWIEHSKVKSTYDMTVLSSELISPEYFLIYYNKILTRTSYRWDTYVDQWVEQSGNIYYYSPVQATLINRVNDNNMIMLYPNPARETVFIQLNGINTTKGFKATLYNATGKQLPLKYSATGEKTIQATVSDIPPGYYLLRVSSDKKIKIFKLIIRR